MSDTSESIHVRGIELGLWLALAGPVAYLLAYRFHEGYLEHFGVPNTFADVDLKDVLYMAGALLSIGYSIYLFLDGFLVVLPDRWSKTVKRRALWLFMAGLAGALVLTLERVGLLPWLILSFLFVSFVIALIVRPLRQKSDAHLTPPVQPDPHAHKGVIPVLLRAGVNRELLFAALVVLIASQMVYSVGSFAASWKSDFLVHQAEDGVTCAVIRARDAELLCAELELNTHKLTGSYQILGSAGVTLHRQAGRLETPDRVKASSSSE